MVQRRSSSDPASDQTPPDDLEARAARGARWVGVGALVSNVVASAVTLVLAAVLRPSDLGVLAIGQLVFVVGNTLQDVGLWDVLVYYRGRTKQAAEAALLVWLSASGVLATVVVLTAPLIARFFDEPRATPVIAVSGLLLVCYAAALVPQALRTRSMDLHRRAQVQLSSVVLGGAVTVVLLFGTSLGLAAMVLGQVTQGVALVVLAWAVGPRVRPRWHGDVLREMLPYGRHLFGLAMFTIAQKNVDYLIVGRVLGASALGVYTLGFRIAFLPYALVTTVLASTMFALACRLEGLRRSEVLLGYTRTLLLLVTPMATGLVVFAPVVTVLGDSWLPAVPVLRGLGFYVLAASVASMAEAGLKAVGRPDRALLTSACHLGLLVVLLLVLAPKGVTVVAAARAGIALVVALLGWELLRRQLDLPVGKLLALLPVPLAGAGVMTAVAILASWSPVGGQTVHLASAVPQALAAVAGYAAVVLLLDRRSAVAVCERLQRQWAR